MAGGRILVVDDEPVLAGLLAEALAEAGYAAASVGDGIGALIDATAAPPDLVLLDVRLPGEDPGGLDGLRVADALAREARTRDVPVVLITGAGPFERGPWAERLAGRGARVLFKPFALADLLATVDELLGRR